MLFVSNASVYVVTALAWVLSRLSVVFPQSKNMFVRQTENFKCTMDV